MSDLCGKTGTVKKALRSAGSRQSHRQVHTVIRSIALKLHMCKSCLLSMQNVCWPSKQFTEKIEESNKHHTDVLTNTGLSLNPCVEY
jgi:hypothetical protein